MSAKVKVNVNDAFAYGSQMFHQKDNVLIAWKIAMELADIAKRLNDVSRARQWYEIAQQLQPRNSQVWIEHIKMEEECGELVRCEQLLQTGLQYSEFDELLMVRNVIHTHTHTRTRTHIIND